MELDTLTSCTRNIDQLTLPAGACEGPWSNIDIDLKLDLDFKRPCFPTYAIMPYFHFDEDLLHRLHWADGELSN